MTFSWQYLFTKIFCEMLIVTCAIIRNEDDEILVVQRGEATDHPFKWEFPGGKLAAGETLEECIIREIREELSIDIVIREQLDTVVHDYGHKKISLIPFICDTLDEEPVLSEHMAYNWTEAGKLMDYDFSGADIFVARSYLDRGIPSVRQKDEQSARAETMKDDSELRSMVTGIMGMKIADWVASYAAQNPAVFLKLYEYSYSSDKHLASKASWALTKVCDKYPELINPYLSETIETLGNIDNESVIRSLLRIISLSDLGKIKSDYHGLLADYCFNQLNSGVSAIAVKVYAMEILYRLSVFYPELSKELATSILLVNENGTAALKSRGRSILRKLDKVSLKPGSSQQ
jgi:8-oxo-dGTP diphosphatase